MILACKECGKRKACVIINGMAICEVCAIDYICNALMDIQRTLNRIIDELDSMLNKQERRVEYGG